jgi:hypothetical protein
MNEYEVPRRCRLELLSAAELAIHDATQAVEDMPADVWLTEAVILLQQARNKVADFVDAHPELKPKEIRWFPMLDGPPIPWSLAEEIHKVYAKCFTNGQSLEGIASRGGFGYVELPHFMKDYQKRVDK